MEVMEVMEKGSRHHQMLRMKHHVRALARRQLEPEWTRLVRGDAGDEGDIRCGTDQIEEAGLHGRIKAGSDRKRPLRPIMRRRRRGGAEGKSPVICNDASDEHLDVGVVSVGAVG